MKNFVLILTLLILSTLLLGCGAGELAPEQFNGTYLPTPIPAPDFTLEGANGAQVSLSDFADKIVLLYFGYTFCPDVCPTTMADLGRVQRALDDDGEALQVIMITVDPERDTPDVMGQYVQHFHPTFVGLSGAQEQIDAIGASYGVYYQKHEGTAATGYLVDHTARVFVIDRDGFYKLSFGFGMSSEDMAKDLRLLLKQ
jgi:protein SCO1